MAAKPISETTLIGALLAAGKARLGGAPPDRGPAVSPLVYDAAELAQADRVVVCVPGAFASIAIFGDADIWRAAGYAPVFYRLPGMDGLPDDHALRIADAADQIAGLLNAAAARDILLVGFSTGGPVVVTAAHKLELGRRVHIALIAPAVERAGGIETRLRGFRDMIEAATRARSLNVAAFWPAYWQTLLFGPENRADPAFAPRIAALMQDHGKYVVTPTARLAALHTADLQKWTLSPAAQGRPAGASIAIFAGDADPVFSTGQTRAFAERIGGAEIHLYSGDGHLPVLTRAELLDDILEFAQHPPKPL